MALTLSDFNRLVEQHGPALFRMAFRMIGDRHEAEDVLQDTYRSVWKSRKLFQEGRSERAWMASILRRRVVDHWRRPRPPAVLGESHELEISTHDVDPARDELTDEMQRALDQLPDELRETLLLVVVAELTHQETADLLGVPLGTVLSRVSRARRRLREYLMTASQ